MVNIETINEIRPRLETEFDPGPFVARTEAIAKAYDWGRELHAGQLRLSGEPYFETHCGWVGGFLDKLVKNEAWTIAGLLHDSNEDQGENLEAIREKFPGKLGDEIAYIVDGVTKISNPGMVDRVKLKPCVKSLNFVIQVSFWSSWQTKVIIYLPYNTCPNISAAKKQPKPSGLMENWPVF